VRQRLGQRGIGDVLVMLQRERSEHCLEALLRAMQAHAGGSFRNLELCRDLRVRAIMLVP
jgi:hypothetical protein